MRLAEVERSDPSDPGWAEKYELSARAMQAADHHQAAVEAQRAAQLEQAARHAAAAEAAKPEIAAMNDTLAASRDQVIAAAAAHLAALATPATLADEHNNALASYRARLGELGLAPDAGWVPVPADGFAAVALRQVFPAAGPLHPLSRVSPDSWLPHELSARPDGLRPPTLADVGATVPEPPDIAWPRPPDVPVLQADWLRELRELAGEGSR